MDEAEAALRDVFLAGDLVNIGAGTVRWEVVRIHHVATPWAELRSSVTGRSTWATLARLRLIRG